MNEFAWTFVALVVTLIGYGVIVWRTKPLPKDDDDKT